MDGRVDSTTLIDQLSCKSNQLLFMGSMMVTLDDWKNERGEKKASSVQGVLSLLTHRILIGRLTCWLAYSLSCSSASELTSTDQIKS